MSRWKRLDNWEEKLQEMSVEELGTELAFWKCRAAWLRGPAHKLTMKTVHRVEAVLARRISEQSA